MESPDPTSRPPRHSDFYVIEEVESPNRYCPGGYHIVNIGDRLNSRYEIINKLGYGSYSTTWLARDQQLDTNVAIKVGVAENDRPRENSILSVLQSARSEVDGHVKAGKAAIPILLDEFEVSGPNGDHHCLVTSPARGSLAQSMETGDALPLATAHAIAAQLVQAVAFLHESGVVHGDLNAGNILFDLPGSIKGMTTKELYETYGEPQCEEVERTDGELIGVYVPANAVHSARLWKRGERSEGIALEAAKILLTDFGESCQPAVTSRLDSRTAIIIRPPEHLTTDPTPVSYASDIWTLGCAIFRMLGYRPFVREWYLDEDRALAEQVGVFGRLPNRLWESWTNRGEWFTEDLERVNGEPRQTLRERMDFCIGNPRRSDSVEMTEEETQALENLFRSMLALNAEVRASAKEVLESEWMVKWALPDLERARQLWEKEEQEVKEVSSGVGGEVERQKDTHSAEKEDTGEEEEVAARTNEEGDAVPETRDGAVLSLAIQKVAEP